MWIVVIIVVVAVVLIVVAGRAERREPGAPVRVADVSGDGFRLAESPTAVISWASIYEVTVTTHRAIGRTGFGFELRSEERGLLVLDGGDGRGEAFLANAHQLPGFDHGAVQRALVARTARTICFTR